MINVDICKEIHKYTSLYEKRWGQEVDYVGMPTIMSEDRLLLTLRYIVNTGESAIVGLKKVRNIISEYHDYLDEQLTLNSDGIKNGYVFDKPCPLCGNKVKFIEIDKSYSFTCDTQYCLDITCRGI